MLLYVKGNIQCKQMVLPENGLECVGVTICLSPEISFNVVVLYRPPNEKDAFFYMLKDVLKVCSNKETIFMGDFNLNWLDKTRSNKLRHLAKQFNLTQIIKNPTRITNFTKTLLDLIFTNKSDRVNKTYNLITGLSDHNLTLVSRKLSKTRYRNQNREKTYISLIPKRDMELLDTEIKTTVQNSLVCGQDCEQACSTLKNTITKILSKYTKRQLRNYKSKKTLPWLNERLWLLMKDRDAALKKYIKSKPTCLMSTSSLQFWN